MKNLEIARILNNIADMLEIQNVPFKPRAYRNAARSIASLSEDIDEIYKRGELENIPGVGEHIAKKIEEIIKTGKLKYYEKLKKEVKIDLESLKGIPSLGPKKIKVLYEKLRIKSLSDLEKAARQQKLRKLSGFGEETEKNILQGIELIKNRPKRFLYSEVSPIVNDILQKLGSLKFVDRLEIAGSFRRGKETIGDLDFLAVSKQPEKVMRAFTSLPDIKKILASGTTKSSILLSSNIQVDLRVVQEKEYGSALLYFIGNKEHNVELRKLALSKGYTLSEYGLFKVKGKSWVAGRTEREVYDKLKISYIPPELRENMGEIKAAQAKSLPQLVESKEIKGMFHNHTNWSDGSSSMAEMVKKAEELKLKFISFNDHFGPIGITNPLNEKRLEAYLKEIEKARKKTKLRIFSGIEIDILKDGTLPLSAKKLKRVDVVIASVHTSQKMPEPEMTKRVCSALENYPINILGHPTGRLLQEREPLAMNMEKVFQVAKARNVFLEINASPERMDLPFNLIKAAIKAGCKLALSSDAHTPGQLDYFGYAIMNARRGWAEKKDILNCWDLEKIEKALKK